MPGRLQCVILAGGRGSRMGSATLNQPKPLVEVGGLPIICHVILSMHGQGVQRFVVATGYLGEKIADRLSAHDWQRTQNPEVVAIDTGLDTATAGRLKRLADHLDDSTILLAWSDGLCDFPLSKMLAFHHTHDRLATILAVQPPPRFGRLEIVNDSVTGFAEKPVDSEGWINHSG